MFEIQIYDRLNIIIEEVVSYSPTSFKGCITTEKESEKSKVAISKK